MDILQHLGPSLNVAYCYGAYEEKGCVGVVMELLTGGELFSRIRTGQYSEKGMHIQALGHMGRWHIRCTLICRRFVPCLDGDTAYWPPAEAARLVREIVRTVAQAHSRGVIIRSGAGNTKSSSHSA